MQHVTTVVPQPGPIARRAVWLIPRPASAPALRRSWISPATAWRETCITFGTHAAPILLFGLIGFAAPVVLGLLLAHALRLDDYVQTTGPLASHDGLWLLLSPEHRRMHVLLLAQAALGCIAFELGRGAITVIALRAGSPLLAIQRLPAQLIGAAVHGALISAGVAGLNLWLREHGLDLSDAGQRATTFTAGLRQISMQAVDATLPQPGPPFAAFAPLWRFTAFTDFDKLAAAAAGLTNNMTPVDIAHLDIRLGATVVAGSREFMLIVLGSLLLVVMAEALFRLRTVMVFKPDGEKITLLSPLFESARFGLRRFALVMVHVWLLRLALGVFSTVFVIAPMAIGRNVVIPFATQATSTTELRVAVTLGMLATCALVNAIVTSFAVVYDARLYMAASGKA